MSVTYDNNVTAVSTIIGALATIMQELVASKVVDGAQLRQRLLAFSDQESVNMAPLDERAVVKSVISALIVGIEHGERELNDGD